MPANEETEEESGLPEDAVDQSHTVVSGRVGPVLRAAAPISSIS